MQSRRYALGFKILPSVIVGLREKRCRIPFGLHFDSIWIPFRLHLDSVSITLGFQGFYSDSKDSVWIPLRFHLDPKFSFGFQCDSVQITGFRLDSIWIPGFCLDSISIPFRIAGFYPIAFGLFEKRCRNIPT